MAKRTKTTRSGRKGPAKKARTRADEAAVAEEAGGACGGVGGVGGALHLLGDRERQEMLIVLALHKRRTGKQGPGTRSTVFRRLGEADQVRAASRYLLDATPATHVYADMAPTMKAAKINVHAFRSWLAAVRQEFDGIIGKQISAFVEKVGDVPLPGALRASFERLLGTWLRMLEGDLSAKTLDDLNTAERHVVVRTLVTVADAIKSSAQTEHVEAQTAKLHAELEKVAAVAEGSAPGSDHRASMTGRQLAGVLFAVMRGESAEEAMARIEPAHEQEAAA